MSHGKKLNRHRRHPSQAARVGDVRGDGDLLVLLKALGVRVLNEEMENDIRYLSI